MSTIINPKDLPPQLRLIIHGAEAEGTLAQHTRTITWREAAGRFYGAMDFDRYQKHLVARGIAELLTKKIEEQDCFTQSENSEGKHFTARAYAMPEQKFFDLMYLAYREGMSEAIRRPMPIYGGENAGEITK